MAAASTSSDSGVFRRLLDSRRRISTQLYLAIGGAVTLTIAASLIGWMSLNIVEGAQTRVNERSVPQLTSAFGIAQHGGNLVAAAPRMTAAETPEELDAVYQNIGEELWVFGLRLDALGSEELGEDVDPEIFAGMRADADGIVSNIQAIESDMATIFELARKREELREALASLQLQLESVLLSELDKQYFYTQTGYRDLNQPQLPRSTYLSEEELAQYRRLAELKGDANVATQLFASAFTLSDASLIEPIRERFEAAEGRIRRNLEPLEGTVFHDEVAPIFTSLFDLGTGEQSGFDLLAREITLIEQQRELLAQNQEQAVMLVARANELVNLSREDADEATLASAQAVQLGRVLLVVISAVSIGGALFISWVFIGQRLLRRLEALSNMMRRMAGGDIETEVEMSGRDEVADMAAALEIFRQAALEAQRLNLVEELAAELMSKNDELESVLEELRNAQDQIVSREKLAALGELTAGVAHEIRNPLNFIKNFSEVSEELIEEMAEVLEEEAENIPEDQRDLIQEIAGDLTGNLERIRTHGDRANRIVHDMLMMGRGSNEYQFSNINNLLDEHARLAYHSARATDPDFQLDMKQELDPDMGELEVISQDLGRVFLNMVGNACDATDEKRREMEAARAADPSIERYMPTLWVATRRGEEAAEITIRDNGNGMPPDVIEKIFNPFFTTKPTGKGTGLGLAMSNDIIREHGGIIHVTSEPGEYTEMRIELPLTRTAVAAEAESEEG